MLLQVFIKRSTMFTNVFVMRWVRMFHALSLDIVGYVTRLLLADAICLPLFMHIRFVSNKMDRVRLILSI